MIAEAYLDHLVDAIRDVVDQVHNSNAFWTEALGLARRVVNI